MKPKRNITCKVIILFVILYRPDFSSSYFIYRRCLIRGIVHWWRWGSNAATAKWPSTKTMISCQIKLLMGYDMDILILNFTYFAYFLAKALCKLSVESSAPSYMTVFGVVGLGMPKSISRTLYFSVKHLLRCRCL